MSDPTPRELTGHKVNPANDRLKVEAIDGLGSGGASHVYRISNFDLRGLMLGQPYVMFSFQNGPIGEAGVNGITEAALIVILIDRMECFQAGPYANESNEVALQSLRTARDALHARTRERMARNIEGTSSQ